MKKLAKLLSLSLAAMMIIATVGCSSVSVEVNKDNSDNSDKFIWATNAEFEPYEYREGDTVVGIDAELAEAIAAKLGKEAEVVDMAFDSIIPAVTTGKADVGMAGITATDERRQSVNFSDSYVEAGQVIIVKKGSDIVDADSLKGRKIAVQLGTTGDLYVTENYANAEISRLSKGAEAVQELINDRVDAVVIDSQPARKFVEANEDTIEIVSAPLTEESYAIAVSKDNEELLNDINKALQELKDSGELDAILDKYLSQDESVSEAETESVTASN